MKGLPVTNLDRLAGKVRPRRAVTVCACALLLCLPLIGHDVSAQTVNQNQGSRPEPAEASAVPPEQTTDPERLELEKEKLRIENDNNKRELTFLGLKNLFYQNLSVCLAFLLALGGIIKYFTDKKTTQDKHDEERFEGVVKSLGSQYEQERISAAVLLFTFLEADYSRFHEQVFNLSAGHLRMGPAGGVPASITKIEVPGLVRRIEFSTDKAETARQSQEPTQQHLPPGPTAAPLPRAGGPSLTGVSAPLPCQDIAATLPTNPLTQPLANVLCESYRRIRDGKDIKSLKSDEERTAAVRRYLNAAGVRLDGVDLSNTDLRYAWLKQASLRGVTLRGAFLFNAVLKGVDLSGATLEKAELIGTNLIDANLTCAKLSRAALNSANIDGANFSHASLVGVKMPRASALGTRFDGADLSDVELHSVKFGSDEITRRNSNPEDALTLKNAVFRNVSGLSEEQMMLCTKKGARFETLDELNGSSPSQPDSSPPSNSRSPELKGSE